MRIAMMYLALWTSESGICKQLSYVAEDDELSPFKENSYLVNVFVNRLLT